MYIREVWLGTWLGAPVAIKTVLSHMAKNSEFLNRFMIEIKLMASLHHPNIVMFLGACIRPTSHMMLVLEYCAFGSLHDFMENTRKLSDPENTLTVHRALRFGVDVARAVNFIHQKCNLIQRDLKCRYVLVAI